MSKHAEEQRRYRLRNPEKVKAAIRKWKLENPEKARESVREWKRKYPERYREHKRKERIKSRLLYPLRTSARLAVYKATKSGKLIRPSTCEACGRICRPEAHHEDYKRKLEVKWLCKSCHIAADKKLKLAGRESAGKPPEKGK